MHRLHMAVKGLVLRRNRSVVAFTASQQTISLFWTFPILFFSSTAFLFLLTYIFFFFTWPESLICRAITASNIAVFGWHDVISIGLIHKIIHWMYSMIGYDVQKKNPIQYCMCDRNSRIYRDRERIRWEWMDA